MNIERLYTILNIRRPRGTEEMMADLLFRDYPDMVVHATDLGEPMAWTYTTDPSSETLFSCHLDTVHSKFGTREVVTSDKNIISSGDDTPLGADDGAGVWLLLEMIDAGVPGTFIFHVGEEKGGIGSKWMAENRADMLRKFKRAIAFDRRDTFDVITHQAWGRCCSDEFAQALADGLNENLMDGFMAPCDGGIYTDTAEYVSLIPECTNVSCGYKNEHSSSETLDLDFLIDLRTAAIGVAWEGLPAKRDVKDEDDDWMYGAYSSYRTTGTSKGSGRYTRFTLFDADDMYGMSRSKMKDYLTGLDPDTLVDLVDGLVIDIVDMREMIEDLELKLDNEGVR